MEEVGSMKLSEKPKMRQFSIAGNLLALDEQSVSSRICKALQGIIKCTFLTHFDLSYTGLSLQAASQCMEAMREARSV